MKRRAFKHLLIAIVVAGSLAVVAASAFVYFGVYNVSALAQHTPPVYRLLQLSMERSVVARSTTEVPRLSERDWRSSGLLLYQQNCSQCHGGPGVGPDSFALGMMPAPTAIVQVARKRKPEQIFWVVKHGIKMTGMPAWKYRMTDHEMWDLVAFIEQIPNMTAPEYISLRKQAETVIRTASRERGDPEPPSGQQELIARGRVALQQYNCISCHVIPGVTAGRNHVGPPLAGITHRAFIAGVLEFNEDNFIRWVRFPRQVDPRTTMPNLGVTEIHAREILAYLRSVDSD